VAIPNSVQDARAIVHESVVLHRHDWNRRGRDRGGALLQDAIETGFGRARNRLMI
jgi:predicted SprT family Zn-dependent metalloprotease